MRHVARLFGLMLPALIVVGAVPYSGEHITRNTIESEAEGKSIISAQGPGFLVLAGVALCILAIDIIDLLSYRHRHNTCFPRVKIILRMIVFFILIGACLWAMVLAFEKPSQYTYGLYLAALITAVSIGSRGFSSSSSFRLIILLVWSLMSFSKEEKDLLRFALDKLIPLAVDSNLWTMLAFPEYLNMVSFWLRIGDRQLLDTLFSESSWSKIMKLHQLQERETDFQRLHHSGNQSVSYAVRKLANYDIGQDSPSSLPFRIRVDLAIYCMDLEDDQLLMKICGPDFGQEVACATMLSQLQQRLPGPNAFSTTGRGYLRAALKDLLALASDENNHSIPYPVQVELVFLYLREVERSNRNDDTIIEQEQNLTVHDREEKDWIRKWVHRFHNPHSSDGSNAGSESSSPADVMKNEAEVPESTDIPGSTTETREEQAIRLVAQIYGRIRRAGTYADPQHLRTYRQFIPEEGQYVSAK